MSYYCYGLLYSVTARKRKQKHELKVPVNFP